jgi:4-hydroxythreonine-4-phosphate dehydrogenase
MANTHPRIAFVMGDPAGISNELAARLLADAEMTRDCATLVIGDRRILALGENATGTSVAAATVASPAQARDQAGAIDLLDLGHGDPAAIRPAEASAAGGAFALRNFRTGLELARDGKVDAVFFTPFNKYALKLGGNTYTDEIQFAADVLRATASTASSTSSAICGTAASPRISRSRTCRRTSPATASSRR